MRHNYTQSIWRLLSRQAGMLFLFIFLSMGYSLRSQDLLFYAEGRGNPKWLTKTNLDGSNSMGLINLGNAAFLTVDMEIDKFTEKVYFSNDQNGTLNRMNFDGSQLEEIANFGSVSLLNIDIDPGNGKIYYRKNGNLYRIDYDGTNEELIFDAGNSSPIGISTFHIDPANGYLYFGDPKNNGISRFDIDLCTGALSNYQALFEQTDLSELTGTSQFKIDFKNEILILANQYTDPVTNVVSTTIYEGNLDGSGTLTPIFGNIISTPIGIDPLNEHIFYVDRFSIHRINYDGTGVVDLNIGVFAGNITDIEICPGLSQKNDLGECFATFTLPAPAVDGLTGTETITTSIGTGPGSQVQLPVGLTKVIYTISDGIPANDIIYELDVTIGDLETPVISCPADQSINLPPGSTSAVVTFPMPTFTENCPGATSEQISGLASGDVFPVGITKNLFKVTDAAGNVDTCSFTVTLIFEPCTDPTITSQPEDVLTCIGTDIEFTVATDDMGPISYLWQEKHPNPQIAIRDLTGVNTPTYSINNVSVFNNNGFEYRVIITNDNGTPNDVSDDCQVTSDWASLTVVDNIDDVITAVNITDASSATALDGQIEVIAGFPVSYTLSGAAAIGPQTSNIFSGLAAGVYDLLLESGNCSVEENRILVGPRKLITQQKIFWIEQGTTIAPNAIYSANPDGTEKITLLEENFNNGALADLALDEENQKLYFIDGRVNAVRKMNFDGSQLEDFHSDPAGIAKIELDRENRKLYFVQGSTASLFRIDLDIASEPEVVLQDNTFSTFVDNFELDTQNGFLYFGNTNDNTITRAVIDPTTGALSNQQVLFDNTDLATISGFSPFVIDPANGEIILSDFNNLYAGNLDGSGVPTSIVAGESPIGLFLDTFQDQLYFNGFDASFNNVIIRANPDGSGSTEIIPNVGRVIDIEVFSGLFIPNDAGLCEASIPIPTPNVDGLTGTETITTSLGQATGTAFSFPLGLTEITYTITGAVNATDKINVIVLDLEDPVISCPAEIITNVNVGVPTAVVNFTNPTFTDNCPGGSIKLIEGLPSGSDFPVGTTINLFQLTDAAGNVDSCSLSITVLEGACTGPDITSQPMDATVCQNGSTEFMVSSSRAGTRTFQWQLLTPGATIPVNVGTNANTLSLNNLLLTDDGNQYRVIISDDNNTPGDNTDDCEVTSDWATLTVVQDLADAITGISIKDASTSAATDGQIDIQTAFPVTFSFEGGPASDVVDFITFPNLTAGTYSATLTSGSCSLDTMNLLVGPNEQVILGDLFWYESTGASQVSLFRAKTDGSDDQDISSTIFADMEVDPVEKKVYLTTTSTGSLVRINFDGTQVEEFTNPRFVNSMIQLDHGNQKLYFGQGFLDALYRADFNDLENDQEVERIEFIINESRALVSDFKLDVKNGHLYYLNNEEIVIGPGSSIIGNNFIYRADIDLVTGQLSNMQSLYNRSNAPFLTFRSQFEIDPESNKIFIYNVQSPTSTDPDEIYVGSLDGTQPLVALSPFTAPYTSTTNAGIRVDNINKHIYFASQRVGTTTAPAASLVRRMNYDGSEIEEIVSRENGTGLISGPIDLAIGLQAKTNQGLCGATLPLPAPGIPGLTGSEIITTSVGSGVGSMVGFPLGKSEVVYTITDPVTSTITNAALPVIILDREKPTINCPEDVNVNVASGITEAVATFTPPTFSDNCMGATIEQIEGLASGSNFPLGSSKILFKVTDICGNIDTCSFYVNVYEGDPPCTGPTLTTSPLDITITEDTDATFSVVASGVGALTYNWQTSADGGTTFTDVPAAINGADQLVLPAVPFTDNGLVVRVIVSDDNNSPALTLDDCSEISSMATLTVVEPCNGPTIDTQPVDATVLEGNPADFSVVASGVGTLTYNWQTSNDAGVSFQDVAAAQNGGTQLTFATTIATQNQLQVRVIITDDNGTPGSTLDDCEVTSEIGTLTITPLQKRIGEGDLVFWNEQSPANDHDRFIQAQNDGSEQTTIRDASYITSPDRDMIIDDLAKKIYFVDQDEQKIKRMNFDGSQVEVMVPDNGAFDMQIDLGNRKLYYTSSGLYRIDLDSNDPPELIVDINDFNAEVRLVSSFKIDFKNEIIYYLIANGNTFNKADIDLATGKISNPVVIWRSTDLPVTRNFNSFEADIESGKLFLLDRPFTNIYVGNLDGSGSLTPINSTFISYPFTVDEVNKLLYYVEGENSFPFAQKLIKIKYDGTQKEEIYSTEGAITSIHTTSGLHQQNDAVVCEADVLLPAPVIDGLTGTETITTSVGAGPGSNATFPVGQTAVTYTITGTSGGLPPTIVCDLQVVVHDVENPTISCPADILELTPAGQSSKMVTFAAPTTTDNCPAENIELIRGLPSGADFPIGSTRNAFKVKDASGNIDTCGFVVTVYEDVPPCTGPNITTQPADMRVCLNNPVAFNVVASGIGSLTYQWQQKAPTDADFSDIPDSNSPTLSIPTPTLSLSGYEYRVIIHDDNNSPLYDLDDCEATSNTVSLTVEADLSGALANLILRESSSTNAADGQIEIVTNFPVTASLDGGTATAPITSHIFDGLVSGTYDITLTSGTCSEQVSDIILRQYAATGYFFWIEWDFAGSVLKIFRANLDGTEKLELLQRPLGSFTDLAVDEINQKLYFTDAQLATINKMDFDGSNLEVVYTADNFIVPSFIELDLGNGKIYFSNGSLYRIDLDGSNEELVFTGSQNQIGIPEAIEEFKLDVKNGFIYYGEFPTRNTISRSDIDLASGTLSNQVILFDRSDAATLNARNEIDIDPENGKIFISQGFTNLAYIGNIDGSGDLQVLDVRNQSILANPLNDYVYIGSNRGIKRFNQDGRAEFDVFSEFRFINKMAIYKGLYQPNDNGLCTADVILPDPVVDGLTGGETIITSVGSGPGSTHTFAVGTTNVDYDITPTAPGNDVFGIVPVIIPDLEKPSISCPADLTIEILQTETSQVVTYTSPVGSDNCPGVTVEQINGLASGAPFPLGITRNTFKVTDASGNVDTCGFDVRLYYGAIPPCTGPTITTQPSDATVCEDAADRPTFSVVATGVGTLSYQWQYRRDPFSEFFNGFGADTYTFFSSAAIYDGYEVRVIITDDNGTPANPTDDCTVISEIATMNIVNGIGICAEEQVAIAEFLNNSNGTPDRQFIELINYGTTDIDITGWTISDEDGQTATLMQPAGYTFGPSDYMLLVITQAGEDAATAEAAFETEWFAGVDQINIIVIDDDDFSLDNSDDEIILTDDLGNVIWSLAYIDDETEAEATYLTTTDYGTSPNVYGSKATPGVDREGDDLDILNFLGYESNNGTEGTPGTAGFAGSKGLIGLSSFGETKENSVNDPQFYQSANGNWGSPQGAIAGCDGPVIATQPVAQSVQEGAPEVSFSVAASGTGSLFYVWQVSTNSGSTFSSIPNSNDPTLTLTGPISLTQNGNLYRVRIFDSDFLVDTTDDCNVISNFVSLTVSGGGITACSGPTITTQPLSISVMEGMDAIFTVQATGVGTLSYKWRIYDPINMELTSGAPAGTILDQPTFTLPGNLVALNESGIQFAVEITDDNGTPEDESDDCSVVSDPATLTVGDMPEGPFVEKFVLVDANLDTEVTDITDGDILLLENLPENFNIIAIIGGTETIDRVILDLNGPVENERTERKDPYAVFGDSRGNYNGRPTEAGMYDIFATPFYQDGGLQQGTSLSIAFEIFDCAIDGRKANAGPTQKLDCTTGEATLEGSTTEDPIGTPFQVAWTGPNGFSSNMLNPTVTVAGIYTLTITSGVTGCVSIDEVLVEPCQTSCDPQVVRFVLVNAKSDTDIRELTDNAVIDLTKDGRDLGIIAEVLCGDKVKSVKLELSGTQVANRTENRAPYSLTGDVNGDYRDQEFIPGAYTLKATPFTKRNGQGSAGISLMINFNVINGNPAQQTQFGNPSLNPERQLTVFPVPAEDELFIDMKFFEQGEYDAALFDVTGKAVLSQKLVYDEMTGKQFQLRTENLAVGVYMLRVSNSSYQEWRKISINR